MLEIHASIYIYIKAHPWQKASLLNFTDNGAQANGEQTSLVFKLFGLY